MPAIQAARESSRRSSCSNNLRQIALAMHHHADAYRVLPYSKRDSAPQRSWAPDILPFLEQANLVSEANYDLSQNWWRSTTYGGAAIPNAATVQTRLSVFVCPSTPNPARMQNKTETAPEQNKVGACGDYFVPEGVNTAINNELPLADRFPASADLRGALRKYPETNPLAAILDGTSHTILVAESAGREDVWRGRLMRPALADKTQPNCAEPGAAPGPPTIIPTRSAPGRSGARAAPSPAQCRSTTPTSTDICSTVSIPAGRASRFAMVPSAIWASRRTCGCWRPW